MKTKFIILLILLVFCIGSNAKDSILINNKHSVQPSLEVSFISGKPTVYVGLGLGLNYSYNFHKYVAIESELLYTHGFKTSNDMVVFPSVDILIGEYRFTPVKTQLVVFSTYLKSYLLNKPNNKLSVGLGITTRGTFDRRNDYIEYYFMGSDNYRVESNNYKYFGLGCIINTAYEVRIKDNLSYKTEFGWRGFLSEKKKTDFNYRSSGSNMMYLKLGISYQF